MEPSKESDARHHQDVKINIDANKNQLIGFVKENNISARNSLLAALILIFAGIALVVLPVCCSNQHAIYPCNCCFAWFIGNFSGKITVALLAEIAGIIFIGAYKSSLKQAGDYRTELIALRDLEIAMDICVNTSPDDFENAIVNDKNQTITRRKSQKSKMQQSVIEALLNRYN